MMFKRSDYLLLSLGVGENVEDQARKDSRQGGIRNEKPEIGIFFGR